MAHQTVSNYSQAHQTVSNSRKRKESKGTRSREEQAAWQLYSVLCALYSNPFLDKENKDAKVGKSNPHGLTCEQDPCYPLSMFPTKLFTNNF
jgi:hypothetical protein